MSTLNRNLRVETQLFKAFKSRVVLRTEKSLNHQVSINIIEVVGISIFFLNLWLEDKFRSKLKKRVYMVHNWFSFWQILTVRTKEQLLCPFHRVCIENFKCIWCIFLTAMLWRFLQESWKSNKNLKVWICVGRMKITSFSQYALNFEQSQEIIFTICQINRQTQCK